MPARSNDASQPSGLGRFTLDFVYQLPYYIDPEQKSSICSAYNGFIIKIKELMSTCFKNRPWRYDLFISIIGGIVASTIIALLAWRFINWIDPDKVSLCLRYAGEYNYEEATESDPIRKILENVPIRIYSGQNLWFAVVNENTNSIEDCTLHLDFLQEDLNIKPYEIWQVQHPNRKFTYMFHRSLNNRVAFATYPLQIEFGDKEKGNHRVTYSITGKNMKAKRDQFFIKLE